MNPIELLKTHCKFDNLRDVYVLFGLARRKNNETITNSQEVVFREILRKEQDIEKKYLKIMNLIKNHTQPDGSKLNFYIYVSVNPRDIIKTLFNLKNKINKWELETIRGVDCSDRFKRIDKEWYSSLMSPECKSGRGKFLIDFDSKNVDKYQKLEKELKERNINILCRSETRNGYHYIVEPFDRTKFPVEDYYTFKIDSLLFVEYVSEK